MFKRRNVLAGLAAVPVVGFGPLAHASDVYDLDWAELVPEGDTGTLMAKLRENGVVEHGQMTTEFDQEEARAVTEEFNGKIVRIPGFIVPLDFDGTGVTTFILAPFVGACIHVPPPPANQLVLVTTDTPYEFTNMYEPVNVTGMFGTAATGTALAEVGYALSAENIEPY